MRIFNGLGKKLMIFALAFSFTPVALPTNTPLVGATVAKADSRHHWRGHRGGYRHGGYHGRRGYYGHRRYYGGRRYYRHRGNGAAVAAGIIGLGVGAAIASSAQPRYYSRGLSARDRYCLSRYRSYDPRSKTYQPYNGPRRICR